MPVKKASLSCSADLELRFEPTLVDIPVHIKETLQGATGDSVRLSACLSENGWMWLVANRTVYVWSYSVGKLKCYTLNLVGTGLHYSADLVVVYTRKDGRLPGALAVSPEGALRHWCSPNAGYVDFSSDFRGQVALSLQQLHYPSVENNDGKDENVSSLRFLLSTTTCSFYIVRLVFESDKRANLDITQLQCGGSMLSSVSRRMSSLLFQTGQSDSQQLLISVTLILPKNSSVTPQNEGGNFVAIAQKSVQYWSIDRNRMLWQFDISQTVARHFLTAVWNLKTDRDQQQYLGATKVWCIDTVQFGNNGVLLLCAAANQAHSRQVHFALGYVKTLEIPPTDFDWFNVINLGGEIFKAEDTNDILRLRLLCPSSVYSGGQTKLGDSLFILSPKSAISVSLSSNLMPAQTEANEAMNSAIQSQSRLFDEQLLGAGCDKTLCYAFLRNSGLVSLRLLPKDLDLSGLQDPARAMEHLLEPHHTLSSCSSTEEDEAAPIALFRNAFVLFVQKQLKKSSEVIDELLREAREEGRQSAKKVEVSKLASELTLEVIDDYPANDPRWTDNRPQTEKGEKKAGSWTDSLLLLYQLEDKKKTLDLVMSFLRTLGLLQRLSGPGYATETRTTSTGWAAVAEHMEKLECCHCLHLNTNRTMPPCMRDSIQSALQRQKRRVPSDKSLCPLDVFYRRVSAFDTLMPGLIEYEQHAIAKTKDPAKQLALIEEVGNVFGVIVSAVNSNRSNRAKMTDAADAKPEWTLLDDFLQPLRDHYHLSLDFALKTIGEGPAKDRLVETAVSIADLILSEEIRREGKKRMENSPLLSRLIDLNEAGPAIRLAEKHHDFEALIRISETLSEVERQKQIDEWKIKFASENFPQLLYQYYMNSGEKKRLLSEDTDQLEAFLVPYPQLRWVREVQNNRFDQASLTLSGLAQRETQSVTKKKTLLSLAKLSALAHQPNTDQALVSELNEKLALIEHQQRVPQHILTKAGFPEEVDRVPPLTATEIIDLNLAPEDQQGTSAETICRCLDLLLTLYSSVENERQIEPIEVIKCRIWLTALLVDNWPDLISVEETQNSGFEAAKQTCYCKTYEKLVSIDYTSDQLNKVLPDIGRLLTCHDQLGSDLCSNGLFQYLLRAGDETARRRHSLLVNQKILTDCDDSWWNLSKHSV